MRIADLYAQRRPIFSFEFFPPRNLVAANELLETIRDLARLAPDYVSVTCPLAKDRRPLTFALIARIEQEVKVESMAHVVTMGYSRDEMRGVLDALCIGGVANILALRGDLPAAGGAHAPRDFQHASDLAAFAREFGLCVGGAAHPEMHPESPDWDAEIAHARLKVDAGCEFLLTQLFFDNEDFLRYVERARAAGIGVPIVPGIMPITSVKGIQRIAALNGNRIPEALARELEAVADDADAVHDIGVRHATAQCADLLQHGAPGIHFYTLNRSPATREVLVALRETLGL
ncbi:MAG: methylenetetrahydrofolate reductase [Myxococcales bacterium]|nr:methylenetetrahydrofolate reductase [Myxococcales bacterium]MDH5305591.1 methylenetetrahydrofolate reductase [Myxococcales bacterium]MDH5565237.1 methylenetetrahydrofolate reductase [Myxococcales bacterium]